MSVRESCRAGQDLNDKISEGWQVIYLFVCLFWRNLIDSIPVVIQVWNTVEILVGGQKMA